jgi:hypothetical protein
MESCILKGKLRIKEESSYITLKNTFIAKFFAKDFDIFVSKT